MDNTKCLNENCKVKNNCLQFTASAKPRLYTVFSYSDALKYQKALKPKIKK